MKHTRFDTRNFTRKTKRLCKICKKQLSKKEIDIHKGCRYDDYLSAFIGSSK